MPLTACIITFNEERNIRECLESVAWADEIVVVDSLSTDATADICRSFGAEVYLREWPGWVEQKDYARSLAQHEWVLGLDADERVTPELRTEIERVVGTSGVEYDGFEIRRLSWYMGRWIRHSGWYPAYRLRLFRKSKARWVGAGIHERAEVDGPVERLRGNILHYPYRDFSHHLQTIDRYSSAGARALFQRGRRCRWFHLLLRPTFNALRKYVLQLGFLDGLPGVSIALTTAVLTMAKYAKLREMWDRQYVDSRDTTASDRVAARS